MTSALSAAPAQRPSSLFSLCMPACLRRPGRVLALALTVAAGLAGPAAAGDVVLAPGDTNNPYLFDVLEKQPALKQTLGRLFTAGRVPPWVRGIATGGPFVGGPSRAVLKPPGGLMTYDACKQHDCGDNQLRILATKDGKAAWALLSESGRMRFFGAPGPSEQAILNAAMAD
ncbi:Ivy family c-type lysozyme inhibitor [Pseudoxanthobacter sp.]|uniref:Ivy family c-type lysozyme inhibitor n=1 Tax=Pseudoxanthobacter sp. TaxID=1925742 RepID=UPI002FE0A9F2